MSVDQDSPDDGARRDIPLGESGLSVRAMNVLARTGVEWISDIAGVSRSQFERTKGCGQTVLREICHYASSVGIDIPNKIEISRPWPKTSTFGSVGQEMLPVHDIPPILTKKEFASVLRVHPRTIERLVVSGDIRPGRKIGRQVRWLREDLFAALGVDVD